MVIFIVIFQFQALLKKIESSSSSSCGFPYKTAILFLMLGIWYMVDKDIRVHKGFESKNTENAFEIVFVE